MELVPRIWADLIEANLHKQLILGVRSWEEQQALHKARMEYDPAYRKDYEIWMAELEAESYWTALYDRWFPSEEEEDWDE